MNAWRTGGRGGRIPDGEGVEAAVAPRARAKGHLQPHDIDSHQEAEVIAGTMAKRIS